MLLFGWSPLVLLFTSPPIFVSILRWLYQEHQLQLVSPSFLCSTIFLFPSKVLVFIFLFTFFQFYSKVSRDSKVYNSAKSLFFLFLLLIITKSGRLAEIRWSICISKPTPEEFVSSILQESFWVMHIPFVLMVKFKLLAVIRVTGLCFTLHFWINDNFGAINSCSSNFCEPNTLPNTHPSYKKKDLVWINCFPSPTC